MELATAASAVLVETHRVHSYAEGRGRCSDSVEGGVEVLVEYREEAVWELVEDRLRLTEIAVVSRAFVDCFGIPFFPLNRGGGFERISGCREEARSCYGVVSGWSRYREIMMTVKCKKEEERRCRLGVG